MTRAGSTRRFKKILIANRGEIAVRIIRACREMDITPVAVFSEVDAAALHVRLADEAYGIGKAPAGDSYLNVERVLSAARTAGADAVHPGYGFLAENAAFAKSCEDAGLVFIGPRSETIALMGEKTSARRLAVEAGVPVVPGTMAAVSDATTLRHEAERIGYPVMVKAAAGGGGKGMRLVATPAELGAAAERARGEARSAFGDDNVYLEKVIARPRHVEIQVMADAHGGALHLFERECSIQRRHQKVIEESPSPAVTPELRERMGGLALALVTRAGYVNAGTVEFLVDADRNPYFLEMNTRLQVEHPVTEMVTGVDLVKLQIRVAQGERLPFAQGDLRQRGHAIECRVYAEDPDNSFLPSPGIIHALRVPGGPGIRDDSGVYEGATVSIHYDPLVSKLVAHGADRDEALRRMRRAVAEYTVLGIKTTLPFFGRVLRHPDFVSGDYDTSFIEVAFRDAPATPDRPWDVALAAAAVHAHRERQKAVRDAESGPGGGNAWRASGWRSSGDRWP